MRTWWGWVAGLVMLVDGVGCASSASKNDVPSFLWGMSMDDVQARLAKASIDGHGDPTILHHFTIRQDGGAVMCVSGTAYGWTYYFAFSDGGLSKVVPAKSEGWVFYAASQTTLDETRAYVLESTGYTLERIAEQLRQNRAEEERVASKKEPLFLLYIFPKTTWEQRRQKERFEAVARRYDGTKMSLGDLRGDVEGRIGEPRSQNPPSDGRVVATYGQMEDVGPRLVPMLVIVYVGDRVEAVTTEWVRWSASQDNDG